MKKLTARELIILLDKVDPNSFVYYHDDDQDVYRAIGELNIKFDNKNNQTVIVVSESY